MAEHKKRRAPAVVVPVRLGGLRYEAPLMGQPSGFAQDGRFVTARDDAPGELVWSQRVDVVDYGQDVQHDKEAVDIKALSLTHDHRALLVLNERGQRFELGLDGCSPRALTRTGENAITRRGPPPGSVRLPCRPRRHEPTQSDQWCQVCILAVSGL
jgi:hypothetical protein